MDVMEIVLLDDNPRTSNDVIDTGKELISLNIPFN